MSQFTIAELSQLSFELAGQEILPGTILQLLRDLESSLEIPCVDAYGATNGHHNNHHHNNSQRRSAPDMRSSTNGHRHNANNIQRGKASSATPATPAFKATKIGPTKTGFEKTINDVRIALNKISTTNFEKQRDTIMQIITEYFASDEEVTDDNTERIAKTIFETAITNKFYSDMYVTLYKTLVETHSIFRDMIDEFVANFTVMDDFPVYVDPDTDYDGFCIYNKACDAKKSASTFLVNCLKHGLILPSQVGGILCKFLAYIQSHIGLPGNGKVVEELVENIFILATLCVDELRGDEMWENAIVQGIHGLVAERGNTHPSFSNRSAFKCMDILDKIR